jgi:hypothetical protein
MVMLWRTPGGALCDARSGEGILRDHERAGGERPVPLGGDRGARGGSDSRGCTTQHDYCHGPNYSGIADLLTQHPLADGNVIYNFHFYDPHEFTHQGAGWGAAWWSYTHDIPYPADESSMAESLKEFRMRRTGLPWSGIGWTTGMRTGYGCN